MAVPRSAVLVPLYIYPLTEETWAPLHKAYACPDRLPVPDTFFIPSG